MKKMASDAMTGFRSTDLSRWFHKCFLRCSQTLCQVSVDASRMTALCCAQICRLPIWQICRKCLLVTCIICRPEEFSEDIWNCYHWDAKPVRMKWLIHDTSDRRHNTLVVVVVRIKLYLCSVHSRRLGWGIQCLPCSALQKWKHHTSDISRC